MNIKAFIFDMDGVIVNSEPEYQRVELELMNKFQIPYGESDLRRFSGVNSVLMWREIKELFPHLELTAEEMYEYEARMMRDYYRSDRIITIKPAIELIKCAYESGYKLAVASSSERENVHHVLEKLNISQYFSAVVTNNDVARCKPDPEIYCLAARLLGVETGNVIVIEDAVAGVASARAAGMKVVWYTSEHTNSEDESVYTVNDLAAVSIPVLAGIFH